MSPQMQKYMKARAVAMGDDMDLGSTVGQASVLQVRVPVFVHVILYIYIYIYSRLRRLIA
jgi:hypothetical protein